VGAETVTLFLAGDVMTGRGVDQVLPCPSAPVLRESYVDDARTYVRLAESANGPMPRPVDLDWPWGDALGVLDEMAPDVRLVNLETSVTRSDEFAPGKSVHYRMHPANVGCLAAARPDVCSLANNHVLDFGVRGLEETLDTLADAGLHTAGAGRDAEHAWRPARLDVGGGRMLVWSVAAACSGVPSAWAAGIERSGVAFLSEVSDDAADALVRRIHAGSRPDDVVVVSVHWGSNWGYRVPRSHIRFAHRLLDAGVHVVHGHSSHHPRPIEVYRNRLVLYGCGDLINDYEGIDSEPRYRDDLRLLYFASLDPDTHDLRELRMVPMQARQLRLWHAARSDTEWLRRVLDRTGRSFGSRVGLDGDGMLVVQATH
jgi:poly-gamma-glutamate capsule biosynthesis protein CapA/YwtB (metallophosphatase superfamily)